MPLVESRFHRGKTIAICTPVPDWDLAQTLRELFDDPEVSEVLVDGVLQYDEGEA